MDPVLAEAFPHRRRLVRVPALLRAVLSSDSVQQDVSVLDLSPLGAFVRTDAVEQPGARGVLRVRSYRSGDEIMVPFRVARVAQAPCPGLGLEFVDLDPKAQLWLRNYCSLFEQRHRVVMVDDDCAILRMIERILTTEGYKFIGLDVPPESPEVFARFDPHLVILDVMMPGVSGLELARRLRQDPRTREVPVLLFTASQVDELAAAVPGVPVLAKGAPRRAIVEIVKKHLRPLVVREAQS